LARLTDKIDGLQTTLDTMDPNERDGYTRDIPTGTTYAAHWEGLDTAGRGAFLRSNGIRLYVAREGKQTPGVTMADLMAKAATLPADERADKPGHGYADLALPRGVFAQLYLGDLARLMESAASA
jgi:hypothetical protein